MISPSTRLEKSVRELVEESFARAIENMGDEEYFYVSSRLVREVAALGGDVTPFVSSLVKQKLAEKF